MRCLVRQDLDTPPAQVSRILIDTAARLSTCDVITAAYAPTLAGWLAVFEAPMKAALGDVQTAGVTLRESLLVTEGRWWSLMCTNPDCCPPEGTPLPEETSRVEAARVAAGYPAVAPSRSVAADRYTLHKPLSDAVVAAVSGVTALPMAEQCDRAIAALNAPQSSDQVLAELVVWVQDVQVRDWVLAHLAATETPHLAQVQRLVDAALRAPAHLRPVVAGTASAALALAGDDPVGVWAMVDHAGDDSLAALIAESMLACLPPDAFREVFTDAGQVLSERMSPEPAA